MGVRKSDARQKPLPTAWAIAQAYAVDHRHIIPADDLDRITGYIRSRDLDRLLGLCDVRASEFRDASLTASYSQIGAFFRKNASFADDEVCVSAARSSFERAERICRITNKRLTYYFLNDHRCPFRDLVVRVRAVIARVLGDPQDFDSLLLEGFRLTSGATAKLPRSLSQPYRKVRKNIDATLGAAKVLDRLFRPAGRRMRFDLTAFNRITLVPKNYKTHRTIACEPSGNLPLQLACDSYIKNRLRQVLKIDLSCQSRNQEMARLGSIDGSIATIDFSMASDTFALDLIHYLFPSKWARIFTALRSPRYTGVFGDGVYEKLSSMGNGFTFTLETLVFSAACVAVGSGDFSVYGDDVCIESSLCNRYLALVKFLGFIPNLTKTFSSGPFRESCGKDYLSGVDVRPFFLKSELNHRNRRDLCHNVNGLIALSWEGSALRILCESIIRECRLPLTCVSEDTGSGIHVDVHTAYRLRLLRYDRASGITYCKQLVDVERTRYVGDARTRFLWHLRAFLTSLRVEALVTSYVGSHTKTVRVRVPWRLPRYGLPLHLFDVEGVIRAAERRP
jgi:hypothetical protein